MSTNSYQYRVQQLVTQDLQDQTRVVVKIYYSVLGTSADGQITCTINDSMDIAYTGSESFTAFEQLSESQVLGWLNANLDMNTVMHHRALLDSNISRMAAQAAVNATLVTQLPWAPPPLEGEPVPDQKYDSILDSTVPAPGSLEPPGCYLLNPDGSLKVVEDLINPDV